MFNEMPHTNIENLCFERKETSDVPEFARGHKPTWHKEHLPEDATEEQIKAFYDMTPEARKEKYGI